MIWRALKRALPSAKWQMGGPFSFFTFVDFSGLLAPGHDLPNVVLLNDRRITRPCRLQKRPDIRGRDRVRVGIGF